MLQLCNQVHAAVFGKELDGGVHMEKLFKKNPSQLPTWGLTSLFEILRSQQMLQQLENELSHQLGSYDQSAFKEILGAYEHRLAAALKQRTKKPDLRKIRLSVFGFSRGAAQARAWVNMIEKRWGGRLGGIPLQIDFLGIFDTVASVGLAQSAPYANGHFAWADGTNMAVPATVKRCAHLVAAFEVRGSFPLDSVCQGDSLPSNCKEIVYPGVHSDVGGGYPPGDQGRALGEGAAGDCLKISQIPLAQMYREARMAGVPLAPEKSMDINRARYFAIAPQLRADFNAYIVATRTATIKPTRGTGDAQFARMFPTETQPRDTVMRLIRRHRGYLLHWQEALLSRPNGDASLPGLQKSTNGSRFQDIEDLRGAAEELRKELAFLQSKDPRKFDMVDDFSLTKGQAYTSYGTVTLCFLIPMLGIPLHLIAPEALQSAIRSVMQEKQTQWDTWLSRDWAGEDALTDDKAEAAAKLFECYVHDSRAWLKPLLTSDGRGMAPDDEAWFTLGGRETEKRVRITKLNDEIEKLNRSGDKQALAAAEQELKQMQQEGQPLIRGGREPYRMWGYLRHRRVYQSGSLISASHDRWQRVVDREEEERERNARRERRIAAEIARYESEVLRITDESRRVASDSRLRSFNAEYQDGVGKQLERAKRLHGEELTKINKDTDIAMQ